MKKIYKWGMGVTALAGTATAITVPVTLAVKNKTNVITNYNDKDILFPTVGHQGAETIGSTMDQFDKDEKAISSSLMNETNKVSMKYVYNKEQEGSVKLQELDFNYELYKLREETKDLTEEKAKFTTPKAQEDNKTRIDDIDKRLKSINDETHKIEDKIKKLKNNEVDYDSVTFSSDFPTLLSPWSAVESKQSKIYNDTRSGFIKQFPTEAEGEAAWITERANKYGGATSDAKAKEQLVYQAISGFANKQFERGIQSEYTVEQAIALNADKTPVYPFLNTYFKTFASYVEGTSTINEDKGTDLKYDADDNKGKKIKKTDKVFYFGTNSKIPSKIIITPTITEASIKIAAQHNNLIKVQHMLVAAVQNEKGYTLPWTVKKDTLKKLFSFYGPGSKDGTGTKRWSDDLTKVFTDTNDDLTKAFIQNASDNAGSKDVSGDLGTKNDLDVIKSMVPGFGIGLLEAWIDQNDNTKDHTGVVEGGNAILEGIASIKDELKDSAGTAFKNNDELNQYIDSLTDEEITNKFGLLFRDLFKTNGLNYAYRVRVDKADASSDIYGYVVVSKNGIHLIKITKVVDAAELVKNINADVKKSFNNQSTKGLSNDYKSTLSKIGTNIQIIKSLLESTVVADQKAYKAFITSNIDKEIIEDFKKEFPKLDDAHINAKVIEKIETYIKDTLASQSITKINDVYTKTLRDYFTQALDNHTRKTDLTLEEIYMAITNIANAETGVI